MNTYDNYRWLAMEIINNNAITDYEWSRKILKKGSRAEEKDIIKAKLLLADTKEFFYSEWFKMLSERIDGPELFKQIKENYDKTGKCRVDLMTETT